MKIIKVKQNGMAGQTILQASSFVVRPALSDEYTVTFEALGLDAKGDSLTVRMTMTRNELKTLQQFAAVADLMKDPQ